MTFLRIAAAGLLAGTVGIATAQTPAFAQGTVKVGLIMTYSGQFADAARQMDGGIKLYMKQHGDKVAGKTIEIIRKDTGGPAPDVAKRLAQELVVRDKVDIIAGFVLTPNAMAASDVSQEAKKFLVIMNAATSVIMTKSQYSARVSLTQSQVTETLGHWAATKDGAKKAYTMVSDYGPGIDSEQAFQSAFKAANGNIVGSVRFPVVSPDFSAFVQRLKDAKSESVFIFVPGGEQPAALGKALAEHGLTPKSLKILASGELTNDEPLRSMGDAAEGIITGWTYTWAHKSALNEKFVKGMNEMLNGRNPDQFAVSAYDGMHVIYEALKKTNGKADGPTLIAAMKGMAWESPRGPISIDPETRDIVQNIYIREVKKVDGKLQNVEFDHIADFKDPGKE